MDIKQSIKDDLLRLPDEIFEKAKKLLLNKKNRDELDLNKKIIENKKINELEAEYERTKDKTLSNIAKRQYEADIQLSENSNYTTYKEQLTKLEEEIKELTITLEFLNNKFKSARSLALLIGDEK